MGFISKYVTNFPQTTPPPPETTTNVSQIKGMISMD